MIIWKRIAFGVWVWVRFFRVCDLSIVYEVLDFMLEEDTSICGMANNLMELTVAV